MQRKNIIVLMISLSLILLLGSSYALLRSTVVGNNPYVINVGNLQVEFQDNLTEKLTLENMYPMSDKEGSSQSKELGFTVKNTGTVPSYYDITLEETSTAPEFKNVIRFISNKDNKGYNEPKTLSEDKYIDLGGYLESKVSSSYKVKIWLDYNAGNEYMNKTFTAKVVVQSLQNNYAQDMIKKQLTKYEESSKDTFQGGLVAVNTDGDLYNETDASQEIREYRYSGPNVNNYVKLNNNNQDELWRIIGVFEDEDNNEEYIRLVKNEVLLDTYFPEKFQIDGIVYNIKYKNNAHWSIKESGVNNNDWATAGLQYYLNRNDDDNNANKGYMSYLSEATLNLLKDRKHYLGTIDYQYIDADNNGLHETAISAYNHEHDIKNCVNNTTNVNKRSGCYIFSGNAATWKGKIGLLYASDYGYSATNNNWNKILGYSPNGYSNPLVNQTSWMYKTMDSSNAYWIISPSSRTSSRENINYVHSDGAIKIGDNYESSYNNFAVRPVLNLKSEVKIISGTGESYNPYTLSF